MEKKPTIEQLIEDIVESKISEKLNNSANTRQVIKDPEQWLTKGKAVKEFGCTRHTLDKAIAENEIDVYQPDDNRTYIKRGDVAAYLESIRIRSKANIEGYSFLHKNK